MSETGLTVKALLKALDKAVHGLAAAPRGLGGVVRSVVVAGDGAPIPAGALVVVPPGEAAALAARPGQLAASAVAAVDGDADGLRGLGLPVLCVDPAVGTGEFAALARSVLEAAATDTGHGDLFSLAQTVATLTGGIVSIEDAAGQVLAYSASGEGADELRRQTILGRGCPESFLAHLREWGVNERIRDGEVVEVAERPDLDAARRLVVGIDRKSVV